MSIIDQPEKGEPNKAGFVRGLYDWMMRNATGNHAWRRLAVFTFAEALSFPYSHRHHADPHGAGRPQARLAAGRLVHPLVGAGRRGAAGYRHRRLSV